MQGSSQELGCAHGPARAQLIKVFAELLDNGSWRTLEKLAQKTRRSLSALLQCELLTREQEQKQRLLACLITGVQDRQCFTESYGTVARKRSSQAITLYPG